MRLKLDFCAMAVKYNLVGTFLLASTWLPFFKVSNYANASSILEEVSEIAVKDTHDEAEAKIQAGKSISYSYHSPFIDMLIKNHIIYKWFII